jgi:branched-chain amino acid transport system ATP-binding protein
MIRATNVVQRFGGLSVLEGVSLEVEPGERRALIGPNGAGKTTLLNIIAGHLTPTSGRISYGDRDVTRLKAHGRARLGLGQTFQVPSVFDERTVVENVLFGVTARSGRALSPWRPLSRERALWSEADALLERWGLTERRDVPVKFLSYGERRIVEIVMALAGEPRVLLLDEPAAGLSGAETKNIIETITALDSTMTLIMVEHDMELVFSVCQRVTVLADGAILADAPAETVADDERVREAYLGVSL